MTAPDAPTVVTGTGEFYGGNPVTRWIARHVYIGGYFFLLDRPRTRAPADLRFELRGAPRRMARAARCRASRPRRPARRPRPRLADAPRNDGRVSTGRLVVGVSCSPAGHCRGARPTRADGVPHPCGRRQRVAAPQTARRPASCTALGGTGSQRSAARAAHPSDHGHRHLNPGRRRGGRRRGAAARLRRHSGPGHVVAPARLEQSDHVAHELVRRGLAWAVAGRVDGQPGAEFPRGNVRGAPTATGRGRPRPGASAPEWPRVRCGTSGVRIISPMMSSTLSRRVSANRSRTKASRPGGTRFRLFRMPHSMSAAPCRGEVKPLIGPMRLTLRKACPGLWRRAQQREAREPVGPLEQREPGDRGREAVPEHVSAARPVVEDRQEIVDEELFVVVGARRVEVPRPSLGRFVLAGEVERLDAVAGRREQRQA